MKKMHIYGKSGSFRNYRQLRKREAAIDKAIVNTMDWWGILTTEPLPLPHH
jgi:hypothetical protein